MFSSVENFTQLSKYIPPSWKTAQKDGIKSSAEVPQRFSDKSQVLLTASTLHFYPLHVTILILEGNAEEQSLSAE